MRADSLKSFLKWPIMLTSATIGTIRASCAR